MKPPTGTTPLPYALYYAATGWAVLPLWPIRNGQCSCPKPAHCATGKHPLAALVPAGKNDATTDAATIRQWWQQWPDAGVAILCDAQSFLAVDVDPRAGGHVNLNDLEMQHGPLPETVESETGGGGRHILFTDPGFDVSVAAIATGVEIKSSGRGYVVAPPTVHASGHRYQWRAEFEPWSRRIVPAGWVLGLLKAAQRPTKIAAPPVDDVICEGARRPTLISLAGSMRRRGMGPEEIEAALQVVNRNRFRPQLTEEQVSAVAVSAGKYIPGDPVRIEPRENRQVDDPCQTILIPGEHLEASGELVDVGTDSFAKDILRALPEGTLYRRDTKVGEILGARGAGVFSTITPDRMRLIVDEHVKLAKWAKSQKRFQFCTKDLAGVVLAGAPLSSRIRVPHTITRYPVFAGRDFTLSAPGWNPSTRVLYDEPDELQGIAPAPFNQSVLDDLIDDFPFRDTASMVNLFGLMLTPLIRPAVDVVPLHLVQSSIERTGKGMLINSALGHAVLGGPVPSVQIGEREEEREKRFTTLILEGATIVHLDNLPGGSVLDSPSLCALTTSPTWKGRTLGVSEMPTLPNTLTLVASANNLRSTGEVAKRIVPIWLQPATDKPESRDDFQHPDICSYAGTRRREVLAVLLGMVDMWVSAGRPSGRRRMGGFEQWAACIGGIMELHGMGEEWCSNREEWASQADEWTQEARQLGAAWFTKHGPLEISASQVLEMLVEEKLFAEVLAKPDNGRLRTAQVKVIKPMVDRPISFLGKTWMVRKDSSSHAKAWRYRLAEM